MRIHHNSQFERLLLGYVDMPPINLAIIPEPGLLQWSPNPYCIRHVFLPSASNSFSKPGWAQTKPCYGYVESFNNSLLFSEKPNYFVMTHIFYFYSIFFTSDLLVLTFWVRGLWARVIPFYAVWTRGSGVGKHFTRSTAFPVFAFSRTGSCLALLPHPLPQTEQLPALWLWSFHWFSNTITKYPSQDNFIKEIDLFSSALAPVRATWQTARTCVGRSNHSSK